uniref:Nuclear transcription factor Y subunit B-1 n=1 Tax=Vincetoxicum mongolicum TaxID=648865 RepID=A0A0N9E799_9GENT|nr:nuclear transcription factor Y subunit B-1 [Vincetoxicum mongolicum]
MTGKKSSLTGNPLILSGDKDQDRYLPIANVSRIMKKSLPTNAKISKEAKETVQECVSEFISFITGEASDKCQREKRKTVNGDDLLWAMTTLGFEKYVFPLKVYLSKYRENEGEKTSMAINSREEVGEDSLVSEKRVELGYYNNYNNISSKYYGEEPAGGDGGSPGVRATNLQYGVEW